MRVSRIRYINTVTFSSKTNRQQRLGRNAMGTCILFVARQTINYDIPLNTGGIIFFICYQNQRDFTVYYSLNIFVYFVCVFSFFLNCWTRCTDQHVIILLYIRPPVKRLQSIGPAKYFEKKPDIGFEFNYIIAQTSVVNNGSEISWVPEI